MPRFRSMLILAIVYASTSGCITPWNTRVPRLQPEDPRTARAQLERFDPFPQPDLGPDVNGRQRDMLTPRTLPRRNNDKLLINKYGQPPVTGSTAQGERDYNQVVTE